MSYARSITGKLESHFVVIHWDQRGSGKSSGMVHPDSLTCDVFETDAHVLISRLLNRFGQRKVVLVGHSWGSFLGFRLARKYPELIHALVAIGPMINQLESERMALSEMKAWAAKQNNAVAQTELDRVQIPFQTGEELYYHRKWLQVYMGGKMRLTKSQVETWSSAWLSMFNEASAENLFVLAPSLHCPVYFFAGRRDRQTNSDLAYSYYQLLDAPAKNFYWFENSAHAIPTTEPEKMQAILEKDVLTHIQ
jgi:pimeloyl-ACP methyl ester carboxylesterase